MELQLCDECAICASDYTHELGKRIWTNRDLAKTSSSCSYCAIIAGSLEAINVGELIGDGDGDRRDGDDEIIVGHPFVFVGRESWECYLQYNREKAGERIFLHVFRTHEASTESKDLATRFVRNALPVRYIVPPSTTSVASINPVKRWLEDCMEFHQERCTPLADIKATPRRLLEITRRRWQSGYKIRLVQPRVEVEYFCLSHCWGNKYESCTTVKSNLSKRMRDIPWKKLPNLFQQALVFTHKLDAKYLWIDSLCIIQDDDQDWSREATKMAGIYENAKLTLAAIAARNSDEDMFSGPDRDKIGVKIEGLESFGVTDEIYVRTAPNHLLQSYHLLRRAWVFQERLLSPRYLHFSEFEVIWECNGDTVCQCSRTGITHETGWGEDISGRFPRRSLSANVDWKKEPKSFQNDDCRKWAWNMIVEEYSSKGITYRKDKLPAISGVVRQFQQLGQTSPYLARLWKDDFFENILWHASLASRRMPRYSDWIAPTWSWVSVGAGVYFLNDAEATLEVNSNLRLLDATCEPLYGDGLMKLKTAYAVVSSPSFEATIEKRYDNAQGMIYVLRNDRFTSGIFVNDYDLSEPGPFHVDIGSRVICLDVATIRRSVVPDHGFGMYSVVLRELKARTYERIGIVIWEEDIRVISDAAEIGSFKIV